MDLNNGEKALIIAIRTKFQYGTVEVLVRDGKPIRIKRAWESEELDDKGLTEQKG